MHTAGHGGGQEHSCPRFDPAPWDRKFFTWTDKRFIVETIPQLFHSPLPGGFRRAVERLWARATEQGAAPDAADALFLAHDLSPWKSEIYLTVTKEVPAAHNVSLTGTFYSQVFDGPYNGVKGYLAALETSVAEAGRHATRYYFHFTSCPDCARKRGHNYILALAELAEG